MIGTHSSKGSWVLTFLSLYVKLSLDCPDTSPSATKQWPEFMMVKSWRHQDSLRPFFVWEAQGTEFFSPVVGTKISSNSEERFSGFSTNHIQDEYLSPLKEKVWNLFLSKYLDNHPTKHPFNSYQYTMCDVSGHANTNKFLTIIKFQF